MLHTNQGEVMKFIGLAPLSNKLMVTLPDLSWHFKEMTASLLSDTRDTLPNVTKLFSKARWV